MLLGGASDVLPNDTWAYDSRSNTWTKLNTAESPWARSAADTFYDQVSGRVILFGGFDNGRLLNDAWAFSF